MSGYLTHYERVITDIQGISLSSPGFQIKTFVTKLHLKMRNRKSSWTQHCVNLVLQISLSSYFYTMMKPSVLLKIIMFRWYFV